VNSQFFGSALAQNGKDSEGFDGFLFGDIRDEIKRASKLVSVAVLCCIDASTFLN